MVWFFSKKDTDNNNNNNDNNDHRTKLTENYPHDPHPYYARADQNEDLPMDMSTLQDIFSFSFIRGRPILNFLMAILWSVGLPILLYHLLHQHIGQVLAMIVASSPPLAIVLMRMFKERVADILGLVAGISFLISGIISIAEPDEKTSAICESIVPLLVGVFCLISLVPVRVGRLELRPLIFQVANQVMPRQEEDDSLKEYDQQRLNIAHKRTKKQKLDYLYTHMSRFRHDMRVITACWGVTLIVTFVVKVIVVTTNTDTSHAETVGYIIFGLATGLMVIFTWVFTKFVKRHCEEGLANATWGVQTVGNTFNQVITGGG